MSISKHIIQKLELINNEMRGYLVQVCYPKAIRIEKRQTAFQKFYNLIKESLDLSDLTKSEKISSHITPTQKGWESYPENYKKMAEICTILWRIKKNINQDIGEAFPAQRRINIHLESAWQALSEMGYSIVDHTGEPYKEGMLLSVLSYEESHNVTYEKVVETIKPSVFFHQQQIQIGEVIVARPQQ